MVKQSRTKKRLVRHHLPLLALSSVSVALLYFTRPYRDVITRASFATAYPALGLLAATLAIGPWNVLRKRRNPKSSDLRRDLGIWAGILGLTHSVIGQTVHLRGRPWLYYVYEHRERHTILLRHDLFGFSNYTGAISALLILALLTTSNDYSLRALGTPRWKQLQRWNYAGFALAAAHTIAYQSSEKQSVLFISSVILSLAIILSLQIAGYMRRAR
jgi:sulfoxide reductase heme-binding subunit YedZ